MEKYSVLITAYIKDKPADFKISLESMINQTIKPDQIVVVYDGPVSIDIEDIVDNFGKNYEGLFSVVKLERNQGLAVALNAGLAVCRNDLVARMDSDDYSKPNRCEVQLLEFEKDKELTLLGSDIQRFRDSPFENSNVFTSHPTNEESIKKMMRRRSPFSHPTVMFRKNAVVDCGGYDPILRRSQDMDLFSKMILKGYKCRNINQPLVLYRADDNSVFRNINKESCKARLKIQRRLFSRKQCNLYDYLIILIAFSILRYIPKSMYKTIYTLIKERKAKHA